MNKVERHPRFVKEERLRMLAMLDSLTLQLKQESDSLRAEKILQKMLDLVKHSTKEQVKHYVE